MRSIRNILVLSLIAFAIAGTASAKEREQARADLQRLNRDIDRISTNHDANWVAAQIASHYGVSPGVVLQDRSDCDCSWGQVMMARSLARSSGRPTREIWALREQGMGWGNIAHRYGTTLGEVMRTTQKNATWAASARVDERVTGDNRGKSQGRSQGGKKKSGY